MRHYVYTLKEVNAELKISVWRKGWPIPGYDPNLWRYDICGNPMKYTEHGNTQFKYGWEIDHIFPSAHGGTTTIKNLQPLQWENNRAKGDAWPGTAT